MPADAHPVVAAFAAGDAEALLAAVSDDVVFHSPVADYRGRETAGPVLRALMGVVGDVEVTRTFDAPGDVAAFLTGTVAGRDVDGVLRIAGDPACDLTLMIRPLDALLAGVEEMRRALG